MDEPIKLALFRAYQHNFTRATGAPRVVEAVPCPLCLELITEAEVREPKFGPEHIVPQAVTSRGANDRCVGMTGDKNSRSGLTLTCTACNGEKGRRLDFPFIKAFENGAAVRDTPTLRTAVLTYSYLFAFAVWGYQYILDKRLGEIRAQAKSPTSPSPWLPGVQLSVDAWLQPLVLNTWGYPCMFMETARTLGVFFWRVGAFLPPRSIECDTPVEIPPGILRKAGSAIE
jgi:hypothetical protein